jgi:hypothetical protein
VALSTGYRVLGTGYSGKDFPMSILNHFKSVPTITTDEVRTFLDEHDPVQYNLGDVGQPGEYEEEHIPGTKLIPLSDLEDRLGELDPAKPTVAY